LEPSFPAGNIKDVLSRKAMAEIYFDFYQIISGRAFNGLYHIYRSVLFLMDPKLIKIGLVNDCEKCHDHRFQFDKEADPLVVNFFMLNSEERKKLRSKLSPTLTSGKMKIMFQTLLDCGQELEKYFEEPTNLVK
jgi:cytochrome P450 family 6